MRRDSLRVARDASLAEKTNLKVNIKAVKKNVGSLTSKYGKVCSSRWSAVAAAKKAIDAEVCAELARVIGTCDG